MPKRECRIKVTPRQGEFIDASLPGKAAPDEVFFGGAAGGGKSFAQVIDTLIFALNYPRSRQLILRRSYPELERSLIAVSRDIFPESAGAYLEGRRMWRFSNGSVAEFGCLDSEGEVRKYQSAEYDVVRFDEVTHFSEYQYRYLLSRVRGTNGYPKQIKSTGNPGGPGHGFIKKRFVDAAPGGGVFGSASGRRLQFIPAGVYDNSFLMKADPGYVDRLRQLPEKERKKLLDGSWDVFEGQYYPEFERRIHTVKPFGVEGALLFRSLDYGLDMAACLWWAVYPDGCCYIYRELYESGLSLSACAERIAEMSPEWEEYSYTVASPDLWSRRQESGRGGAEVMAENGLDGLVPAVNSRVAGWRLLREKLSWEADERGNVIRAPSLFIMEGAAPNLVRTLPQLLHDAKNPEDAAVFPHEVTHAPDSLRYGVMSRPELMVPRRPLKNEFFAEEDPDSGPDRSYLF